MHAEYQRININIDFSANLCAFCNFADGIYFVAGTELELQDLLTRLEEIRDEHC